MSEIHQLFCTHCTHGSSALEQRDGELAERTFGYSVRAGSLEGEALRKCYEQLEPLLYYHLPRDTPDEQKLQLTAGTAPRRFFGQALAGGVQVCGQVCYRPTDSEGRPGSYFAHVLLRQDGETSPRWTPAELLRLWGAPGWVTEDSPEIPFKLEPLGALSDLLQSKPPAIDDALLGHFLRDGGDGLAAADPSGVIPERWRAMEPEVRRDWLIGLLCAVVHSATAQGQPLVLVAEPSAAALLFYGVARLLPPGLLAGWNGFSTFEPDPDRAAATLAATWPFDQRTSGGEEPSPWQRTTLNTLRPRPDLAAAPGAKYGEAVVRRFLELVDKGGEAFDGHLKALAAVQIAEPKDLDALVEIDQAVETLLEKGTLPAGAWRQWPPGIGYLKHRLVERLEGLEDVGTALKAVTGGPAHLAVIDVLCAKPALAGARRAVVHLLKTLPPDKILGLLKLGGVPDEDKVTVLARHIHAHGTLPPGCEFLWEEWAEAAEQPRRAGVVLMARVLATLPSKSMEKLAAHVPQRCAHGFLLNCLKLVQNKKMKTSSFTAMIRAASTESVYKLVSEGGPQFLANYPKDEPGLGEKMVDLLRTLVHHPDDFKERLDLILAGQHLLGEDVYHTAAAAWDKCYKSIQEVGRLQRPDASMSTEKRHALLVAACREMAMAADRAMTLETMDGEYTASQKRDFLLKIGQRALGGTPLLIPGAWETEILMQRIDSQFQNHRFPTDPLKKEAAEKKKKEEKKEAKKAAAAAAAAAEGKPLVQTSRGLLIGTIVMIVVLSAAILFGLYSIISSERPQRRAPKKGPRDRVRQKTSFDQRRSPGTVPQRAWAGGLAQTGVRASTPAPTPWTDAVVAAVDAMVWERILRSG